MEEEEEEEDSYQSREDTLQGISYNNLPFTYQRDPMGKSAWEQSQSCIFDYLNSKQIPIRSWMNHTIGKDTYVQSKTILREMQISLMSSEEQLTSINSIPTKLKTLSASKYPQLNSE